MNHLRGALSAFWVLALGVVVLYVFFVMLDAFDPGEVWGVTIVAAILAALLVVHFVRVRHALDQHGRSDARRALNEMRERRGF